MADLHRFYSLVLLYFLFLLFQLELLDHNRLLEYKELRLAHLQLCLIASGYIWQDGDDAVTQVLLLLFFVFYYPFESGVGVQLLCKN